MNKIIIFLFLLSVFFISFQPVKDTDFGWHYRCGKEFWVNQSICLKNNFSYFLPNYQSAYPSLLYDIPLTLIYDRFGFNGLSVFYGLLVSLAALIFINLTSSFLSLKIIGFYLTFFLSYLVFGLGLRSQIISYLFFLLTIFILEKSNSNKKYFFLLPSLFLVWVNAHIGFFIGLIILLFSITENVIRPLHDRTMHAVSNFAMIIVFLASLIAILINPFGINVYKEILNHTISPMNQMIAEWVAPPLWQKGLIFSLTIIAIALILKRKSFSLFTFLLITFFAAFGLMARRNLPFFYTSFFFSTIFYLRGDSNRDRILDDLLFPLLISAALFFAIINIPSTLRFHQSWDVYCNQGLSRYPCDAIKNYPQLSGNVFNTYEWGGFLIWQKPEIKVFVDGRMPAWKDEDDKSPYQVFLEIIQAQPGWNEKLTRYKTDYLLIAPGTFLDLLLQKEATKYGWSEKYRDEVAVIYKKI